MNETDVRHPAVLAQDLISAQAALDANPLASVQDQHNATKVLLSVLPSLTAFGEFDTPAACDVRGIMAKGDSLPTVCCKVSDRLKQLIQGNEWPISQRGTADATY